MARVTPEAIGQMKARGERIPMLTAYDYATAQILDATGIPLLLVGDSLGMVVLGHESTLPVTVDDIIRHTQAVVRGSKQALIIADLPFGSFQVSPEETMRHAVRIMKKAAPQAVKLEGGVRSAASVRALTEAGIPVMGHVGMTPQSVNVFGGFKVQGKTEQAARAARGCRGAGRSGRLRRRAGARAGGAGTRSYRASVHSDHRHRRRPALRWRGAGAARRARTLPRFYAAPHQALRRAGPGHECRRAVVHA